MNAKPINLNKVRKARARADKKVRADKNVVAFGRSKADKAAERQEGVRTARILDGAALETPPKGSQRGEEKP